MKKSSRTYYDILQVSPNANSQEIKTAYRRLALQHHPDRNFTASPKSASPTSTAKEIREKEFKLIGEAYKVLSDPQTRRIYDKYGDAGIALHSQLGERNPKLVEFILDTRKVLILSLLIAACLAGLWISLFLGVRKCYGLNDFSWRLLLIPLWALFGVVCIGGLGTAWYVIYYLDVFSLAQDMSSEGEELGTDEKENGKTTASLNPQEMKRAKNFYFMSIFFLFLFLFGPFITIIFMAALVADVPGIKWPIIPFSICSLLLKLYAIYFVTEKNAKNVCSWLASFSGVFSRILAFYYFTLYRNPKGLLFILFEGLFTLVYLIILIRLPILRNLFGSTKRFIVNLIFHILFVLPIALPIYLRYVNDSEFSLHWCLIPLHLFFGLSVLVFGLMIPAAVLQWNMIRESSMEENKDAENPRSSLDIIRQKIFFYAFAPRQLRIKRKI